MEAQDVDSEAVFLLILGLQLVGQIGVAHAVQVRHTLPDEAVGFGAVEEAPRIVQVNHAFFANVPPSGHTFSSTESD